MSRSSASTPIDSRRGRRRVRRDLRRHLPERRSPREDGAVKLAFAERTPINATPTTLVLDGEGRVAARIIGQLPDASILTTLVRDALEELVNPGAIVADGALWVAHPDRGARGTPLVPLAVRAAARSRLPRVHRRRGRTAAGDGRRAGGLGADAVGAGAARPATESESPVARRLLVGVLLFIAGFTVVFMTRQHPRRHASGGSSSSTPTSSRA